MGAAIDLSEISTDYIMEWEREAKVSDDWLSLPARSTEPVPAQT
jgi:hypothetical protein